MLNESDLNALKGALHFLNSGPLRNGDLRLDTAAVIDSNGEKVATIVYEAGAYGIIVP